MHRSAKNTLFILLIATALLLVACGPRSMAVVSTSPTAVPTSVALPTLTNTALPRPTRQSSATATVEPVASSTPSAAPATPTPLSSNDLTATARPTAWPTPDHPLTGEERSYLFNELWTLINERYLYEDFNGLNWQAQYDPFLARALAAPNDDGYYEVLRELVDLLGDRHSRFMSPSEAIDHFALTRNDVEYGGLGLYTMPLPDGAFVLQVIPGSPADRAGVQACDRITAIDGGGYWGDGGEVGTTSTIDFFRPEVGAYNRTMTRELVEQVLQVPAELLPWPEQRIAYVRIDTLWVREAGQQMRDQLNALSEEKPVDGLILDLRSNVGGWRPTLQSILGTFLPPGDVGEFSGRLESEPLTIDHPDDLLTNNGPLPMVVLVGPRTESYAEVLAAVLQAEGRATVLGQGTQGNVETIFPRRLPYGARVWIAEQGFTLNNGSSLEGVGVIPDIYDESNWTQYACGRDPQVTRAAIFLENLITGTQSSP